MPDTEKLLNCPFCGEVPVIHCEHYDEWRITCDCAIELQGYSLIEAEKQRLILAWNTRPTPKEEVMAENNIEREVLIQIVNENREHNTEEHMMAVKIADCGICRARLYLKSISAL